MRKNRLFVLGIITMFVAILSLTLVSGTMARYTSTVSGQDDTRVAKWAFTVSDESYGNGGSAVSEEFTFDLFNTIEDTLGGTESDISDNTGTIIAPGTCGSFILSLKNTSEVTAEYSINFTVTKTDADLPIQFSIDNVNWYDDLEDISADGTTKLASKTGTTTVTVQWKWEIGPNDGSADANDTALGIDGTATVTVKAEVTFTQVD